MNNLKNAKTNLEEQLLESNKDTNMLKEKLNRSRNRIQQEHFFSKNS